MRFNQNIFNSLIPKLKDRGFDKSIYTEHNGGLEFYKSDDNIDHRITLDLGVSKIGFVNIYGRISFLNVIEILSEYIELRPNIYEAIVVNYDLYKNKEDWIKMHKRLGTLNLKTISNIEYFENEIINHIDSFIIPFFSKFPTLKSVNNQIFEKLSFEEFPNYITGNCTLKTLIIMKMYGNPRYEEYKISKNEEYKFYVNQNSSMWKSSYDSFLSLIAYLDKSDNYNQIK